MKTVFLVLLICFSFAPSTFAKMMAPQTVSSPETISFFQTKQKNKKLTAEEADILTLASLAHEVFGVKDLHITEYHPKKEEMFQALTLFSVATSIQGAIQTKSNWNERPSSADLNRVSQSVDLIKKSLGDSSYTLAWIKYQLDEKKEAKEMLLKQFVTEYDQTMKLNRLDGFRNASPMQQAEAISKALAPMSTETENKSRDAEVKKMRLHISSLPDMQMMT